MPPCLFPIGNGGSLICTSPGSIYGHTWKTIETLVFKYRYYRCVFSIIQYPADEATGFYYQLSDAYRKGKNNTPYEYHDILFLGNPCIQLHAWNTCATDTKGLIARQFLGADSTVYD